MIRSVLSKTEIDAITPDPGPVGKVDFSVIYIHALTIGDGRAGMITSI